MVQPCPACGQTQRHTVKCAQARRARRLGERSTDTDTDTGSGSVGIGDPSYDIGYLSNDEVGDYDGCSPYDGCSTWGDSSSTSGGE